MHPQLMPVPFYEDTVVLVGQGNEPYVAMKPIVTNMGLHWAAQFVKIAERFASVVSEIETTGGDGKQYSMTCLPLRKLPAWLYSISPNKVKPELRDKIIRYQEECDDALWDYWTKGSASRPGTNTVNQQIAMSRHRVALLEKLLKTRDNTLRAALHEQLAMVSQQLGLSIPSLESIGKGTPGIDERLAPLWDALKRLDALGIRYNHSKKPRRLALHWTSLNEVFSEHGISLHVSNELKSLAEESKSPLFVARERVESAIDHSKQHRCHVFIKEEQL